MIDSVQLIKERLNIIDVISAYVEIKRAGKNFIARCPFHHEKTPSFHISPERGNFHCFGCGVSGDIFSFVQEMEKVDFRGALQILAQKAGVELTPISPQAKSDRDRLYALLEEATNFFVKSLEENSFVQEFIENRGVGLSSVLTWRLGFAPGSSTIWRATKEYLLEKGFTEKEMLKAGLIKTSEKGKSAYDVFRNRVMFPIFDQSGRVVAFSGRTLEVGTEVPKYVNSPETELFKKSEILYGLHLAKHNIRRLDFSLLVEGQFDVVMSHKAGYNNTVAVSGTALTVQHVQILEKMSKKVVLALDADKAGINAMKKAANLMLKRGLDVKVAVLPDGKDPADIIKDDVNIFRKIVGHSVSVIDFFLKALEKDSKDERNFRLRAREEVLPFISLLPDKIDQDFFEGKVAEALKTTKEAVHYEVERISGQENDKTEKKIEFTVDVFEKNEVSANRFKTVLNYLFGVLPVLEEVIKKKVEIVMEEVSGEKLKELEKMIDKRQVSEVTFRVEDSLENLPKKLFEDELVHNLNQLRSTFVVDKLKVAKEELKALEKAGCSKEEMDKKLSEIFSLQEIRRLKAFTPEDIW